MSRLLAVLLALGATSLGAQDSPAPKGVAPDWDIRVILQEFSAHALRLLPVIDQVDVKSWVAQGASETYLSQVQSVRDQVQSIATQSKALAARPEKLSSAFELFIRMVAVDSMLRSLEDGIRRYQKPELADTLASVARESTSNRERFQQYILEMAVQREHEYSAMDHEAQRCRGMLALQPPPARTTGRKK